MDQLRFSYNWNGKLSFSDYFTTIRMHNEKKFMPGNVLEIYLEARRMDNAEVIDRKSFYLKDLNHFMAGIDTGYSLDQAREVIRKMYKNVKPGADQVRYDFVLLKWIKEPINQQSKLFAQ